MKTNTPRTDALKAFQEKEYYSSDYVVRLHYFEGFARELERELEEQLRLNGMGSEREARLMARVAELERENAALREIKMDTELFAMAALANCEAVIMAGENQMRAHQGYAPAYVDGTGFGEWGEKLRDEMHRRAALDAARKEAQP